MTKEFFGTGDSAIRPDKPMTDRNVVIVLVKHSTEKKCLCVKNRKFGWVNFVMGGIEGDETVLEAAEREVVDDFEYIKELPEVFYDNFYAAHKDVNRHITCHIVYGKLKSLNQIERSEEEIEIADVLWVKNSELAQKLSVDAHKYALEQVLKVDN